MMEQTVEPASNLKQPAQNPAPEPGPELAPAPPVPEYVGPSTFQRLLIPGVIVSLLTVIAALLALFWLTRPPSEASVETAYTRDMIAHHEQAVEMALILRERGVSDDLDALTLDMVLTQQAQIGQMQGWLAVWGRPLSSDRPVMGGMGPQMGMAAQEQLNELRTLPLPEAEVRFLQLMIRHHQGAVWMAREIGPKTDRPVIYNFAVSIIGAQGSEIAVMRDLLTRRGAQPLPDLQPVPMDHGG
jgi:uncharacterized protein (DUF305 family)